MSPWIAPIPVLPILVAIAQNLTTPYALSYPTIRSFVEAELIVAKLNARQEAGDRQRIEILRRMLSTGGTGSSSVHTDASTAHDVS
ncbi:hypothetical protein AA042_13830 [Pseudomonas lundensis]|nr:hypothetical protein AA042_13830 [Pseudomonas lundensis]